MSGTGALAEASPRDRWTGYVPLSASSRAQLHAATLDVTEGIRRWRGWTYLAMQTTKSQYRRTVLGPWWLTLQTAAYILALAAIFSNLLHHHNSLRSFLPYVALGFMGFQLLSGLTRTASTTFVSAAGTMQSTRQPLSSYVFRDATIEFVQFGHNVVIYFVFLAAGLVPLTVKSLIAIPIVVLIAINGCLAALWLGPTVARFRDVGPLVASILQMAVFFTPIFYRPVDLGPRRALIEWNPFTYLLGAFRDPLIGAPLEVKNYVGAVVITVANLLIALVVFSRSRSRIPYWVA